MMHKFLCLLLRYTKRPKCPLRDFLNWAAWITLRWRLCTYLSWTQSITGNHGRSRWVNTCFNPRRQPSRCSDSIDHKVNSDIKDLSCTHRDKILIKSENWKIILKSKLFYRCANVASKFEYYERSYRKEVKTRPNTNHERFNSWPKGAQ